MNWRQFLRYTEIFATQTAQFQALNAGNVYRPKIIAYHHTVFHCAHNCFFGSRLVGAMDQGNANYHAQ